MRSSVTLDKQRLCINFSEQKILFKHECNKKKDKVGHVRNPWYLNSSLIF